MTDEQETAPTWSPRSAERLREALVNHPGRPQAAKEPPDPPAETPMGELKRLYKTGGLTQGVGSRLIGEQVARDAMHARCRRLGALHMLMAKQFYARAVATTADEIRLADESIGNLQAELKNAES
jgi:hypothetical protein